MFSLPQPAVQTSILFLFWIFHDSDSFSLPFVYPMIFYIFHSSVHFSLYFIRKQIMQYLLNQKASQSSSLSKISFIKLLLIFAPRLSKTFIFCICHSSAHLLFITFFIISTRKRNHHRLPLFLKCNFLNHDSPPLPGFCKLLFFVPSILQPTFLYFIRKQRVQYFFTHEHISSSPFVSETSRLIKLRLICFSSLLQILYYFPPSISFTFYYTVTIFFCSYFNITYYLTLLTFHPSNISLTSIITCTISFINTLVLKYFNRKQREVEFNNFSAPKRYCLGNCRFNP